MAAKKNGTITSSLFGFTSDESRCFRGDLSHDAFSDSRLDRDDLPASFIARIAIVERPSLSARDGEFRIAGGPYKVASFGTMSLLHSKTEVASVCLKELCRLKWMGGKMC